MSKKETIIQIPAHLQSDFSKGGSKSNGLRSSKSSRSALRNSSNSHNRELRSSKSRSFSANPISDGRKEDITGDTTTAGDAWSDAWSDVDDSSRAGTSSSESEYVMDIEKTRRRTKVVCLLLVAVGLYAGTLFLYLGVREAKQDEADIFHHDATNVVNEIRSAWNEYEQSALWIHESCREWRSNEFGRRDFEILYHYLAAGGVDFWAAQWIPNVAHSERPLVEQEGSVGWGSVEGGDYQGIVGWEPEQDNPDRLVLAPRSQQPYYFPVHFGEPKERFHSKAHFDLSSSPWERDSLQRALDTWKPSLTPRGQLLDQAEGFSVVLYHPGTPLPPQFNASARDLASIVINVQSFLARAARFQEDNMAVYLYDSTLHMLDENMAPEFMGGLQLDAGKKGMDLTVLNETEYDGLKDESYLYFEMEMKVAGRQWTVAVVPVDGTYKPHVILVIVTGAMIFGGTLLLAYWTYSNMLKSVEKHRVMTRAAAEAQIVKSMFPENVRERMIEDALVSQPFGNPTTSDSICLVKNSLNGQALASESLFGTRPIAELHPSTTVCVADLQGFTAWASEREPQMVFTLLELLFHSFDRIAKRRRVLKVETRGDVYIAVAGLPNPRSDHSVVMARFASNCCRQMRKICKALEKTLGPDTSDLGIRIGLHSGQVIGGVLRGDKGRFQLFGETMQMAVSIQKAGERNKIHVSQETAEELAHCGRGHWAVPRDDEVALLGKGKVLTFFLEIDRDPLAETTKSVTRELGNSMNETSKQAEDSKVKRLIAWNVEVLSGLLRKIVARRQAGVWRRRGLRDSLTYSAMRHGMTVLEEASEIITLPTFDECAVRKQGDPASIVLDPGVVDQLTMLVTTVASMYRDNPFHNFEHASHVTMSVVKMMGRIVDPKEIEAKKRKGEFDSQQFQVELHDHTFGITSDPLTQFACAFSALIHDLDHTGVSNMVLIKEGHPLCSKYNNKSIAEQNSVDLSWQLLMAPAHGKLRSCICATEEEFARFRSLVVNSVMATDIMDKELQAARKQRWNLAFKDESSSVEDEQLAINRKATIVIEHLIQASDVSHTMQHWQVYVKWNERLFHELYNAYKEGRIENDPSEGWHKGEIGFFDFYIIPLAKKLFTCGVFGVSSDEFLNYALTNRKEWEQKGADMVNQYLLNYNERYGKHSAINTGEIPDDNRRSTMTTADMSLDSSEETVEQEDKSPDPPSVESALLRSMPERSRSWRNIESSGELTLPELEPIMEDLSKMENQPPPIEDVFLDEYPENEASDSEEQSFPGEGASEGLPVYEYQPEDEDMSLGDRSFLTALSSLLPGAN